MDQQTLSFCYNTTSTMSITNQTVTIIKDGQIVAQQGNPTSSEV